MCIRDSHAADNDAHSGTNNIGWSDDHIDNYNARCMELDEILAEYSHYYFADGRIMHGLRLQ